MNPTHLHNKVRGMLLLGALGDALGAVHEQESAFDGIVLDPGELRTLPTLKAGISPNPWGFWPPPEMTGGRRGVPTDDTAFRFAMLHPWLVRAADQDDPLNDDSFVRWAEELADGPADDWLSERKRDQARDWVSMYRAQANAQSERYYKPDAPVAFGLFMFLPLAALYADSPPEEIFRIFAGFTRLDQSHAGVGTGLFACLLAQAIASKPIDTEADIADWFRAAALETVDRAGALDDASFAQPVARYRLAMEHAWRFAQEHNQQSEHDFARAFSAWVVDACWCPGHTHPAGGCTDPLTFWVQFHGALIYTKGQVNATLRLLASMSGDCDTAAMLGGTLLGGLLGYDRLNMIRDDGPVDRAAVIEMESNLHEYFGHDSDEAAKAYTRLPPWTNQ
jgi:ADP-ribosylglycohydrolase